MPDEVIPAGSATPEVTPDVSPVAEPTTAPAPVVDDLEKEPGGDDPQAVRARKEYRLRKRLEAELNVAQQERIAAQARAQTLEELRAKPSPEKQRVYSVAELQTAIDAGTISVAEAADYLAERRANATAERVLKEERTRVEKESQTSRAQQKIDAYVEAMPWLRDKTDSRRRPLEAEYQRLVGEYQLADNLNTEALVLEKHFGSLEAIKAKARLDADSRGRGDAHVESGAGGGFTPAPKPGQKPDMTKIPKHHLEYWDKMQFSQKERESMAQQYFKSRSQK